MGTTRFIGRPISSAYSHALILATLAIVAGRHDAQTMLATEQRQIMWTTAQVELSGWVPVGKVTEANLLSLAFSDPDHGWAVGDQGTILRYFEGTWSNVESPTSEVLRDVALFDGENGWAVGENGTVLRLDDNQWNSVAGGPSIDLRAVGVGEDGAMLIAGDTRDTDPPFTEMYAYSSELGWSENTFRQEKASISSLHVFQELNWVAVGRTIADIPADDGHYIHALECPLGDESHYCIGLTLLTGGEETGPLHSIARLRDGELWAVGEDGVLVYREAPESWTPLTVWPDQEELVQIVAMDGEPVDLFGVVAPTSGEMWAVGGNGTIAHAVNTGGEIGRVRESPYTLRDIVLLEDGTMWASGDSGTLLHYGPVEHVYLPWCFR